MRRGGVLSILVVTLLCGTPCAAGEKPALYPMAFTLPGVPGLDLTIDPAGVRGALPKSGPRPIGFRPNISLGWQITARLRLGPEIRHDGGSSVIIGIGMSGTLP